MVNFLIQPNSVIKNLNCIERAEEMWKLFQPYADDNFQIEFNRELSHAQRYSEMFFGCALIKAGFSLQRREGRQGPDLLVNVLGKKLWIEVVTPVPGTYKTTEVIERIGPHGILGKIVPDKIMLKVLSVARDKALKYREYLAQGVVTSDDICMVAINTGTLAGHCGMDVVKALLGFEVEWYFDGQGVETEVVRRTTLKKNPDTVVPSGIFSVEGEYSHISGALFAHAGVGNIDDVPVGVVHNKYSQNIIPKGVFSQFKEYRY